MPIQVECLSCHASFRVADQYAGKRGKCPHCKEAVSVPAGDDAIDIVDDAPAPAKPGRSPKQILKALEGEIEPVRPTPLYRFWIVVVAGIMLALPMIYVALIALVGYGLVYYATHATGIFHGVRNARGAIIVYFGPLIAGAVVVAFMLKPLFARSGRQTNPISIDPDREPLIYDFVDAICRTVGAPTPRRIDVDCRVNASASLDGGPLAIGKGLVLTIGLPLVAGLDLKQFAGVLAHEFGHFSQRIGMRLSGLIRWTNHWFARVVYERDSWDETLAAWSTSGEGYQMLIAVPARIAVWLTRRVLWALMMIGHLVSGFLSRQMEFDADRYQARMVGGDVLAQTMERIGLLAMAENGAYSDLGASWRERRLPDDLPRLVLANLPQIPAELRESIKKSIDEGKTGLFDTHPADRERIAAAKAEAAEGIFRLGDPATDLFRDFEVLSREATFDQYKVMIGTEVSKDQLYPVAEAIEGSLVAQHGDEAFARVFLEGFSAFRPLLFPSEYPHAPDDLKAAKRELAASRARMIAGQKTNAETTTAWDEARAAIGNAETAATFLRAGMKIKAADFGLDDASIKGAEAGVRRTEATLAGLDATLARFDETAVKRLLLALGLFESEIVVARVPDGLALRDEARGLYPYTTFLGFRVVRELGPVLRAQHVFANMLDRLSQAKGAASPPLVDACLRASRRFRDELQEFQSKIGPTMPYPFEHAQADISLVKFLLPFIPEPEAVGDLFNLGGEAIEKTVTLYRRILGRLAVTTESVETAIGITTA
jgi:Zn-dependent protease with chaperone function